MYKPYEITTDGGLGRNRILFKFDTIVEIIHITRVGNI